VENLAPRALPASGPSPRAILRQDRQEHLYSGIPGRTVCAQSRQTKRPSLYAIIGLHSKPTRQCGQRTTRIASVRFCISRPIHTRESVARLVPCASCKLLRITTLFGMFPADISAGCRHFGSMCADFTGCYESRTENDRCLSSVLISGMIHSWRTQHQVLTSRELRRVVASESLAKFPSRSSTWTRFTLFPNPARYCS
jgi:hypothetical protein